MSRRFSVVIANVALTIACVGLTDGPAEAQLRSTLIASGFSRPVGVVQDPSDKTVQIVLEQAGRIRAIRSGVVQANDFIDLTGVTALGSERGILGLAFAPDYAASGRVFISFTDKNGDSVIARFKRSAGDPLRLDPSTRFDLVWPNGRRVIAQPFTNHNGGHVAFGPDGYLYVGLGDGGSGNDPMNLAQRPDTLLGKMLRIDVSVPDSDPQGYDVPPTNPFLSRGGVLPEIWSFGLRNPWRWSFDEPKLGGTGAMVIGDVGQNAWEEVSYEPAGAGGRNYGWRIREGAHDNVTNLPPFSTPLVEPIWEYARHEGRCITGGYVYRGRGLGTSYAGRYFFADFVTSRVWSILLTVNPITGEATGSAILEHTAELGAAATSITSFGSDSDGELFVVSYGGSVYRIDGPGPQDPPVDDPPPTTPNRPFGNEPIGRARPRG